MPVQRSSRPSTWTSSSNTCRTTTVPSGVLKDAIRCIRELTLDGNQVKLDELAMFSIGLMTKPANSAKEFMASKNIVGYRLRARATGEFTKKELALAAKAREDNEYSVDKEDEGNDEP